MPALAHPDPFALAPIAEEIWREKYRFNGNDTRGADLTIADTWARVADAAASAETGGAAAEAHWRERFREAMASFAFLPGGRILAGAGTGRRVTLFNCFVLGEIPDTLDGIFAGLQDAAVTMQQGGGIGHDFSTLRPRGATLRATGASASGPVSFMDVWDAMCRTVMSAGARRGAMMATLRCDHPDIRLFIEAKQARGRLTNFNLSVLVTDAFIAAVRADGPWDLVFDGHIYETISARALWHDIMTATYDHAEPGVIFIDRVNAANNLGYCETIAATNPCGEQPLPPYGACLLGAMNLTRFVAQPFSDEARLDTARLAAHVKTAVRLLDNIIDVSNYPLEAQRREAVAKRRLGLGITGLANALAMCGARYGGNEAVALTESWLRTLKLAAYEASADLAAEKGAFPLCDSDALLARANLADLPDDLRQRIAKHGLRNGCLTTIAPTGTISLVAGNVSSGIEPTFARSSRRRVLEADGSTRQTVVTDYAAALHKALTGTEISDGLLPDVDALTPADHIRMQRAAQAHIDSAISKTINCPSDIPFAAFENIYLDAFDAGLKGCTTYRPSAIRGAVLEAIGDAKPATDADGGAGAANTDAAGAASGGGDGNSGGQNVIYLAPPDPGDDALAGVTYRHALPGDAGTLRVTVNDTVVHGRPRPCEILISSDVAEDQVWLGGLARMASALLARDGNAQSVVDVLRSPRRRAAAGAAGPSGADVTDRAVLDAVADALSRHHAAHRESCGRTGAAAPEPQLPDGAATASTCPSCGEDARISFEGCWVCRSCGVAACG